MLFCGTTAPSYCTSGGTFGAVPNNSAFTLSAGYMGTSVVNLNKAATSITLSVSNGGGYGVKVLRETNGTYAQDTLSTGDVTLPSPQDVIAIYIGTGGTCTYTISY